MDRPLTQENINTKYRRLFVRLIVVGIIVSLIIYSINWIFSPSLSRNHIRSAFVKKETIAATINAGGLVVPLVEETILSEVDTQILRVIAQPGTLLKKGDPILQLDTKSVQLRIDNIQEKLALKDTQIHTKQLLLTQSVNDINSRIALLQVDLESRETKADQLEQLSELGAFSKHEILEAHLNVKRTKIELKQLSQSKHDIGLTTAKEIEGLMLEKSLLMKEIEEQQRLLKLSMVTATRDGVLSWLKSEEGASVAAREPLAKISDNSKFRIEATLSDFYASQLVPGMKANILYDKKSIDGQLSAHTPTIENGVMKLIVELENPHSEILRNNLRVDVGFITQSIDNAFSIAKGPFISGRGIQQVFVIRNNHAYKTEIEVGISDAQRFQIIDGLKEGDEVIISDVSNVIHLNNFAIN